MRSSAGSSPRVRGKLVAADLNKVAARLIPACAGKTSSWAWAARPMTAHPRVCGENRGGLPTPGRRAGSSPRVRGKRADRERLEALAGLIPACAGKTWLAGKKRHEKGAHPRVCGENYMNRLTDVQDTGSSPRVRGKRRQTRPSVRRVRLIPACAGKTWTSYLVICLAPAHPRVCGENSAGKASVSLREGSSPRVRGKHVPSDDFYRWRRLIPACAGKTLCDVILPCRSRAHPRVCGENSIPMECRFTVQGSSPRVRGKRLEKQIADALGGLIPACAGKTTRSLFCIVIAPAHPRVCGENKPRGMQRISAAGSSPRVRGKLGAQLMPWQQQGLIPACAGKTLLR